MPTTAALIPSNERKITAYFFKLFQTGKKNKTSKALGANSAIEPIKQPNNCIFIPGPSSRSAIPPTKEPMENTGPGIARTMPAPVRKSVCDTLSAFLFCFVWSLL